MIEDEERCYRALEAKDARFDGWFFVGVTSTGIFCRPSCPARTPKRANVRFYATAAAAQAAGFRACRRCRPDTAPGSPEWDVRGDLVGRAMRLIADGLVDREGVGGLARRMAVSERHLNRLLTTTVGAGPLALARARRAHTARILIETTTLPFTDVAFAAGFASIRQFNDTIRETFGASPTVLRTSRGRDLTRNRAGDRPAHADGHALAPAPRPRPVRRPPRSSASSRSRAVPGIEEVTSTGAYRRVLDLTHGPAVVELAAADDHVDATLQLSDLRDLTAAVERCRRLLDLDADPVAIDDRLGADPLLGPLVAERPGLRSPGTVDGAELAVRAVIGQQVSVAGARTVAGRLTAAFGKPLASADGGLTHCFPTPEVLAEAPEGAFPMPRSRGSRDQGPGRRARRGRPRPRPGRRSRRGAAPARRAARHRSVDGGLRRAPRPRRSGLVHAHRPRRPPRARAARRRRRPGIGDVARRRLATVAVLRPAPPVGIAHWLTPGARRPARPPEAGWDGDIASGRFPTHFGARGARRT